MLPVRRWGGAPAGPWGLVWRGWSGLRTAGCYVLTAGDAALGLAVLAAAPWAVYRSGMLGGEFGSGHSMPFTRLLAGLGLACGLAGWVVVGRLGGSRSAWLAVWEAWVAAQLGFAAAAHRVFRVAAARAAGPGAAGGGSGTDAAAAAAADMYERSFAWLHALMWALVGVALPLLAGWLPFWWAA